MTESAPPQTYFYRIVRYVPNLVRDEWVNIGVLLLDPATGRVLWRLIESHAEFRRLHRIHPLADERVLRGVPAALDVRLAEDRMRGKPPLAWLDDVLSDTIQVSRETSVLAADMEEELGRLYYEQVEPTKFTRRLEDLPPRNAIYVRMEHVFRSIGIWPLLQKHVPVEEYTQEGDNYKIDYSYRRNGTRGFVQAFPLESEATQVKVLVFTADEIRSKLPQTEFTAVTEVVPHPEQNQRHQFVLGLLGQHKISVVPLTQLPEWARRLGPSLRDSNGH